MPGSGRSRVGPALGGLRGPPGQGHTGPRPEGPPGQGHTDPRPEGPPGPSSARAALRGGAACLSVCLWTPRSPWGGLSALRTGRCVCMYADSRGSQAGCPQPCGVRYRQLHTRRFRRCRLVPPGLAAGSTSPQRDFALVLVLLEAFPVCLANPGRVACVSGAERVSAVGFSGGVCRESLLLARNRPTATVLLAGRCRDSAAGRVSPGKGEFWFGREFITV